MKRVSVTRILLISFCVFPLLCLPNAAGAAFDQPPDTHFPGWQTAPPYQRNILWDFSSNPNGPNGDQSTPGNPGPSPGAVYSGTEDETLWVSDFIVFTEAAAWIEAFGGIGVDNRNGNTTATGTATFHLDNLDFPNLFKHLYFEADISEYNPPGGTTGGTDANVTSQPGALVSFIDGGYTDPAGHLFHMWEIIPNPAWEEIAFTWDVQPGGYKYFRSLHFATECVVPIPSAVLLLGSGLVGLAGFRKKFKKS